jgi:heme exporter protein B
MHTIWQLVKKEWRYEMRQKVNFIALLLYGLVTVFLIFLLLDNVESYVWNTLYWVVLLFTVVNAIVKSFSKEYDGIMLYYYQTVSPHHFFLAKVIYHTLVTVVLGGFIFIIFHLLGNPVVQLKYMLLSTLLGCVSMAVLFSFVGALNNKAGQAGSMNIVLGFPLLIPQLLLLARVNGIALGEAVSQPSIYFLGIFAYSLLIMAAGYILYPYIWRS